MSGCITTRPMICCAMRPMLSITTMTEIRRLLAFVVDDGILPWDCDLGDYLTKKRLRSKGAKQSLWAIPRHTKATLSKPEYNPYLQLSEDEKGKLHRLFASEEVRLKAKYRSAWQKRLRALGYDVIASAY